MKKLTLQDCIDFAILNDGYCNSQEYISNKHPMSWKCKYGHTWLSSFTNMKHKKPNNWCPYCNGFAKHTLQDCIDFAISKNGKCLSLEYKNANSKMKWECSNGHSWETKFSDIKNGNTWCKKCFVESQRHTIYECNQIANAKNGECLSIEYKNAHEQLQWKCKNGHTWDAKLADIKNNESWCMLCYRQMSAGQEEITAFIDELGILLSSNNRKTIKPLELDIYIPSKNIAIEYCGLYWHSELSGKNNKYHINKLKLCKEKGIRLITIFEDEWINKQAQVEGYLTAILGKVENKIDARKCVISEVDKKIAKQFHNDNHIQGAANGKHIGLYFNNELMCVATFSRMPSARSKLNNNTIELIRYTAKINYSIRGGLGKLLKYFVRNNADIKEIVSYSDNRWSEGNIYKILGFIKVNENTPSYWYFKKIVREHKCRYQKNKLSILYPNEDIINNTEWEIMKRNGYNRIWDCGNIKWLLKIK